MAGAGFGGPLIIWYDMIWYDKIWYDMIWYDIILENFMIWYDMIWYDMIWYDMIWYDNLILKYSKTLYNGIPKTIAWYDIVKKEVYILSNFHRISMKYKMEFVERN